MKVLFVCKGNVGRSQLAEGLFNNLTKKHHAISSGTIAKNKGKLMKNVSIKNVKILKEVGIDISNKKVKKLNKKMAYSADKIIVFCDRRTWPEFLLKSDKVETWISKDTQYMTYKERRVFRNQTKKKIQKLLKELEKDRFIS